MKIGTLVRNKYAVRTNPVVQESLGCEEVPAGFLGVVVDVRETELNAWMRPDGKGDTYVDVHLQVKGEIVRCGNYLASAFEEVTLES